ncbi:MAG: hypothetical protein OS112_03295 [Methanoregula sp.]|nr:MAG: hypothetical protein OS112_03295 [Methanoregula sp.]
MYEELIVGLVLLDVGATLAGNWRVWQKIADLDRRLIILETKIACGAGVPE